MSPQPSSAVTNAILANNFTNLPDYSRGRRAKKDRASYITPPLTPSSSINTTGSVESSPDAVDSDFFSDPDTESTRIIVLGNLKAEASKDAVKASVLNALPDALTHHKNLDLVDTRLLSSDGDVFVVFTDIRHARMAFNTFSAMESLGDCSESNLTCQYITPDALTQKLGYSIYSELTDGAFYLTASTVHPQSLPNGSATINVRTLKGLLAAVGDLASFTFIRDELENKKTFHVSFYDVIAADNAYRDLHNQVAFGMKLAVHGRQLAEPVENSPETIYSSRQNGCQFPNPLPCNPYDPHQAPQWENEMKQQVSSCATPDQNCNYCPSRRHIVGQLAYPMPPTPPTLANCGPPIASPPPMMPHIMMSPPPVAQSPVDYAYQQVYNYQWQVEPNMITNRAMAPPHPHSPMLPFTPPQFWVPDESRVIPPPMYAIPHQTENGAAPPGTHYIAHFQSPPASPPTHDVYAPSTHSSTSPTLLTDALSQLSLQSAQPGPAAPPGLTASSIQVVNGLQIYPPGSVSAAAQCENATKNQLNIQKIEEGQDTRTTVMIKNIPNKMSDKDLIAYIAKVVPRRIDFLYLRMDFQNGCNVGYAFVNFITVEDLLKFAKARLGEKWNMFSSEKVLQMSYANYQGKEALVEKFKNSCIMDERESWRPKIFYSYGPNQGLPEPFPAPTHIRRKERSSFNRGALFVPGVHHRHHHNRGGAEHHGESNGRLHGNGSGNGNGTLLASPMSSNSESEGRGGGLFTRKGLKKRQMEVRG
ncbi:hypothetical protein CC2G_008885 [Coprinopsis cinerea AmutBmut pab1-1]|nr:hypothetical protein CC2G_008885 [Coprinopsis cinerea AmutBmut pab1-1]